jgi:outer membrane protein assembly factor BamD
VRTVPLQAASWGLVVALAVFAGGCGGKKKYAGLGGELLGPTVAYREGMEQLSRRNLHQAIGTLGRIQYSPETLEDIEPLARLAVADATFYQGNQLALIDARSLYLDFVTLYGDHPLAPYAQTQAGLCSLRQVNHPSKDQSQTHHALGELLEVIRRYPDSDYAEVARTLTRSARSNFAETEFIVGRFYAKKKKHLAALERFSTVLGEYPEYPETDKVLYYMGRTLFRMNSDTQARIYLSQLVHDYPDGDYAQQARKLLEREEGAGEGSAQ